MKSIRTEFLFFEAYFPYCYDYLQSPSQPFDTKDLFVSSSHVSMETLSDPWPTTGPEVYEVLLR